ncbi:endolytic transglycosylase MltG [Flavihumibacter petaseus]|uniref:Endolytic murein transglycosylase n=1 Tax=Flavihumibacter petaseus NBRC 106054 TaxID=1220578 RepID=A0A0E9N4V0_9BACT|nr:endolytic transglycosylase MltG [Flavihumibacter petaseus]GAO44370.1 hypothetical protein FPE01S_03_04080 [Flavihumibacter petaseus NBRC 106054]
MKKVLFVFGLVIVVVGIVLLWGFFGPATSFRDKVYYLEIPTGSTYGQVLEKVSKDNVVKYPSLFDFLAKRLNYPDKIKAGRYAIHHNTNLLNIIRKLRNGAQEPVNLVINKLRTKEDFAGMAGRKFESDSIRFLRFLNSNDSLLPYGLDSNTVLCGVLPDTYTFFWNTSPQIVMNKILENYKSFWTSERKDKATEMGLTPVQVSTLASIVDEETNNRNEKGNIASVYLNRLKKGMRLGADPTVKFALRDFSLKRIYHKHLLVESPYNTYRVTGLPPGPICTPQKQTIDAVLNAPSTNYLFFVAKPGFTGAHAFAADYQEHLKLAREYQQFLDSLAKNPKAEETGH